MSWNGIFEIIQTQGMRLLSGILVLAAGLFLTHWAVKLLNRNQKYLKLEPTLKCFLHNLTRFLLYILVILTAVAVMGIPLTSVVAILASAGVAVSLALQGVLGNFVGGVMLLILKPIRVGEYVKIGDADGTVDTIGVFYTELNTPDNRHITLPNSSLTGSAIINFSRQGTRRLDVVFSVSYSSDIDQVRSVLMEVVERCGRYLAEPAAPAVILTALSGSSMDFTVRLHVKSSDYWDVNFFLIEEGKKALDRAGIEIPFPQMDVHMK